MAVWTVVSGFATAAAVPCTVLPAVAVSAAPRLVRSDLAAPQRLPGNQEPFAPDPASPQDPLIGPSERLLKEYEGREIAGIRVGQVGEDGTFMAIGGPPADPILRLLSTKVGAPLDGVKLQSDVRRLVLERSLAATVFIEPVDNRVILYLAVLKSDQVFDELNFKGVEAFDNAALESILDIVPNRAVSRLQVESMRNVLLARYRREGYAYCSIDVIPDGEVASGDPFRSEREFSSITMWVDEGPKVTVRDVLFRGNESFPGSLPFSALSREPVLESSATGIKSKSRWALIPGAPFSAEVIEEDLDRLRLFYRAKGFRDAQVALGSVVPTADRDEVNITFRVVEGARYTVASVELERLDETGEALAEGQALYPKGAVMAEFLTRPGDPYDAETITADLRRIREFYGARGHPVGANIQRALRLPEPDEIVDPRNHEIHLIFQVIEGTPKRLRDVVIRGNTYTQDRVVRRKVFQGPGDRVNMPLIERSERYLRATQYFRDPITQRGPQLTLQPVAGQPDEVDLDVAVTDGETGRFRWGVGISTNSGVQASILFRKENADITNLPSSANPLVFFPEILDSKAFHGAGQTLNLLLAPGTEVSQFALSWSEPDVFGMHQDTIGLNVGGGRDLRRFRGYSTDRLRATVGLARNFTENLSLSLSFRQESIEVENPDPNAPTIVFDSEGRTELRGTELRLRHDDRDNRLFPSDGTLVSTYGEVVGGFHGGEASYWLSGVSLDHYLWLREDVEQRRDVLHFGTSLDVGGGFGKSDRVFLTDRWFMGGNNLRGFDFRGAGPSQFGQPTGGEARLLSTAEYFFPLVPARQMGPFGSNELIRGVVFTDFGLLGTELDSDDFFQPRLSAGFGIRIFVPMLNVPIALDFAWPLIYEESDDRQVFSFNFSYQ